MGKKHKSQAQDAELEEHGHCENENVDVKKKKHKKSKRRDPDETEAAQQEQQEEEDRPEEEVCSKKKKKRSHKELCPEINPTSSASAQVLSDSSARKPKKKKYFEDNGAAKSIEFSEPDINEERKKSKKKKHLKSENEAFAEEMSDKNSDIAESKKKKRKNSDVISESVTNDMGYEQCDAHHHHGKSKKKKKCKKVHEDHCKDEGTHTKLESMETLVGIDTRMNKNKKKSRKENDSLKDELSTQKFSEDTGDDIEERAEKRKKKKKKKKRSQVKADCEVQKIQDSCEKNTGSEDSKQTIDKHKSDGPNDSLSSKNTASPQLETGKVSAFGQWSTANLGNDNKQQKFLRLLGGFKKPADTPTQPTAKSNMAMDQKQQESFHKALVNQFTDARNLAVSDMRGGGLGYQPPPDKGKKFYINVDKSKSHKFAD